MSTSKGKQLSKSGDTGAPTGRCEGAGEAYWQIPAPAPVAQRDLVVRAERSFEDAWSSCICELGVVDMFGLVVAEE